MSMESIFPFIKKEADDRIDGELNLLRSLLRVMERDER